MRKIQALENPMPYLADARDAAAKILTIQRDLLLLKTEMSAVRNAKRGVYLSGAAYFGALALGFLLFWITVGLHDAGWSAWWIALLSLGVLGAIAGVLALLASRAGPRSPEASK